MKEPRRRTWQIAIIGDISDNREKLETAQRVMQTEEKVGNKIIEVTDLDRLSSVTDLATGEKSQLPGWGDFCKSGLVAEVDAVIIVNINWVEQTATGTRTLGPAEIFDQLRKPPAEGGLGYTKPIFVATDNWRMNDQLHAQGALKTLHWESFHGYVTDALGLNY